MRVAHVVHAMVVGGAEMLVANLVRASDQPEKPVVLCMDGIGPLGEALRSAGFVVEQVERRPGIDWSLAGRLAERLRAHSADLVHCHQYTPWFYGGMAAAKAGLPIVFTEHGRHQPDHPRLKRVLFNQWLMRRTAKITAVSESIRRALVANEKIPERRIEVLYNGIDAERFHPDPSKRIAVREALGLAVDAVVVLTAGRLVEIKNQRMLLRAARRLRDRGRDDIVVLVAGGGPLEGELRAEIAVLDLDGQVRLLGERDDVPDLLCAADVFTLTSWSEGTSITLLEAMSSAVPAVVTAVGGNPELVEEGVHGHLVASDDDEQLAAALIRLADDPSTRERMGAAGRENVLRRFTFDGMRRRFDELYAEALQ